MPKKGLDASELPQAGQGAAVGLTPPSPGRQANMRAIHRRGTKPEQQLASALHSLGFRFRRDYPIIIDGVRVRPDIVFTRKKVAIFVDGCFWHCCPEHGHIPKVNQSYWAPKLARNCERDERDSFLLEDAGWTVLRVWEHQVLPEALCEALAIPRMSQKEC